MGVNEILTILNLLVTVLAVAVAVIAWFQHVALSRIKKEFAAFQESMNRENYAVQQATQRLIASYGVEETERKIALIESALRICPKVFNGHNALGHAHLSRGDVPKALDAFHAAIAAHPDDKAGYFDLALAYLRAQDKALCLKHLRKAVQIDPTAVEDLRTSGETLFKECASAPEFQALQGGGCRGAGGDEKR